MSDTTLQLVVGLGNPGPQYERTRHNAGFWLVDELARGHGSVFRHEPRFKAEACRIRVAGHTLWLLKPLTFMNLSGQAVAGFAAFYRIPPAALLVVYDELDLPPGTVRLKRGGGHGGHKGLRDIVEKLGSGDFLRLRLGIGHPGHRDAVLGHVLHPPALDDRRLIDDAIADALRELPRIVEGQVEKAMHALHSRKPALGTDDAA